jgi:hypothetical protein
MSLAPFTATEVRDATRDGRTWVFRLDADGAPALWRRVVCLEVDDDGCRLAATLLDADGHALGEPHVRRVSWDDVVAESEMPADASVEDARLPAPDGELAARVYTSSEQAPDGSTLVTRAWFADALPGAPVRYELERQGVIISRLVLEAHEG